MYDPPSLPLPDFPPLRIGPEVLTNPYQYLGCIFVLALRVTHVLIKPSKSGQSAALFAALQTDLNQFHSGLTDDLRFDTGNFKKYANIGQGAAFVLIHVSPESTTNASYPASCADIQLWFHTYVLISPILC
jgi:hypothetical protein